LTELAGKRELNDGGSIIEKKRSIAIVGRDKNSLRLKGETKKGENDGVLEMKEGEEKVKE
jgi:hypothetical protein